MSWTMMLAIDKICQCHPGLTRVRSIRVLLFEIRHVLVSYSTIFKLTILFNLYFLIHNVYADKKVFKKKG